MGLKTLLIRPASTRNTHRTAPLVVRCVARYIGPTSLNLTA